MASTDQGGSQSTRALLLLRQMLLDGDFLPGTRMAELPLVERLGVSRTPLRNALSVLAYEGFLEPLPGGGYTVRSFTQGDVEDAIELRGVLEGTVARLAAERRGVPVDVGALHAINAEMDDVVRAEGFAAFERYLALNQRFHDALLKLARSPMVERTLAQVIALPFASPNAFVLAEAELPESREILLIAHHQHREITQAVERGEGTRAESLGREHARLARRNLEIVLKHGDVLAGLPGASLLRPRD